MPNKSVHGYMSGICPNISILGGGVVYDMSICRKTENRVNLGLKRRMSKTHMSLCFYVFGNAPMDRQKFMFRLSLRAINYLRTIWYYSSFPIPWFLCFHRTHQPLWLSSLIFQHYCSHFIPSFQVHHHHHDHHYRA